MDRGPLVGRRPLRQFAGALLLPVVPYSDAARARPHSHPLPPPASAGQMLASYCRRMAGAAATAAVILAVTPYAPVLARHWLYTLATSFFLGGVFDALGALAVGAFGLQVAPTFDAPWLSSSFSDFWRARAAERASERARDRLPPLDFASAAAALACGCRRPPPQTTASQSHHATRRRAKRWNLSTTHALRVLVFEPVLEGRAVRPAHSGAHNGAHNGHPAAAGDDAHAGAAGAPAGAAEEAHKPNGAAGNGGGSNGKAAAAGGGGSASGPRPPRVGAAARYLALQATFAFSGLWHLFIFWCMSRRLELRWFAFFAVQAPILAAEAAARRALRSRGLRVPRPLAVVATNLALIVLARPVFFGPVDESDFRPRAYAAVEGLLASARAAAGGGEL